MIQSNKPLKYITSSKNFEEVIELEIKTVNTDYNTGNAVISSQDFYVADSVRYPIRSVLKETPLLSSEIENETGTEKEKIEKAFLTKINNEKWFASSGTDFEIKQ